MKRFYKDVTVAPEDGGWRVLLDGRPIRTAAGRAQVVPSRPLADALGAEWADQGAEIDAGKFALRDLADYALDIAGPNREAVIGEILPFAETDTLAYRADPEDALHRRQWDVWEPLLAGAERRLGVRFERVSGVIHRPLAEATRVRLQQVLEDADAFTLAALRSLASLAASLVIALEAVAPGADADALWAAADLEEEWQAELWGRDAEAEDRRARRRAAFEAAMRFAALARE